MSNNQTSKPLAGDNGTARRRGLVILSLLVTLSLGANAYFGYLLMGPRQDRYVTQAELDVLASKIEEVDHKGRESIGLVSSGVGGVDNDVDALWGEVDLLGAKFGRFPQPHNLATRKDLIDVYETMKLLAQSLGSSGGSGVLIGGGGGFGGGVQATEVEAPIGCYNGDVVLWTYDGLGC